MQLVPGKDFWQVEVGKRYVAAKNLENQPGGACFRLAVKWLLCKAYNRPFKSYEEALTGRTATGMVNAVKTFDKQQKYLNSMEPYERPGTPYPVFLAGVRRESRHYIKLWGNKTKSWGRYQVAVTDTECASLDAERARLGRDIKLIIGIAGTNRNMVSQSTAIKSAIERLSKASGMTIAENWAHAFAYYRSGKEVRFFDSNGGEYDLSSEDPVAAIEQHTQSFYTGYEKVYGFTGTEISPGITQHERDISGGVQFTKTEDGFKSVLNYLLFEVTTS